MVVGGDFDQIFLYCNRFLVDKKETGEWMYRLAACPFPSSHSSSPSPFSSGRKRKKEEEGGQRGAGRGVGEEGEVGGVAGVLVSGEVVWMPVFCSF